MQKIIGNNKHIRLVEIVPLTGVSSTFTYYFDDLKEENLVGYRVLIPLGSRTLTGIVVKDYVEAIKFDESKLKGVIEVLDTRPIFSKELIELAFWTSQYYFAPIGDVFKAMLPPGFVTLKKQYVHIAKNVIIENQSLSPNQKKIIDYLEKRKSAVAVSTLRKELKIKSFNNAINKLISLGLVVSREHLISKPKKQIVLRFNTENFINPNFDDILKELRTKKKIVRILKLIYERVISGSTRISYEHFRLEIDPNVDKKILNYLSELGFITIEYVDSLSDLTLKREGFADRNELELELNEEQIKILNKIIDAIEKGEFQSFLLFGVTGSGKTLIYMHAIRKCFEIGKSALVLVPEISLTPQLVERFEIAFPNNVVVLHSRLKRRERIEIWSSIISGEKKVVVGARSAVFAPLKNLGLIIVDEEHEPSFKQEDPDPRYNARDVALYRGKLESAITILGSATPSVSSIYSTQIGKHQLLEIRNRADGANLPKIYVVDLLKARQEHKLYGQFSAFLVEKIKERLEKKEGVILFQNRRGFALILVCTKCGYVPKCPNCEVSLTFHKTESCLKCHYCGFQTLYFSVCPKCRNSSLKYFGYGTQRIEEEIRENLKQIGLEANIARFDLDIARQNQEASKILKKFYYGEIDILVGTQMIAKGLDFGRVTLVGIINADLQINLPDYSSAERAFQLFTQVAGRAGRKSELPGEVIIQTYNLDSYIIKFFAENDYYSFYRKELKFRKQMNYPPFSRFISIEFQSKSDEVLKEAQQIVLDSLRNLTFVQILGPATPLVPKVKGLMRKILLLKVDKKIDPTGKKIYPVLLNISKNMHKFVSSKFLRIIIDVDSQFSLF